MKATTLLREQMDHAHGFFEWTMRDVTIDQLGWLPPGKAHPIGAQYAHLLLLEDAYVNALLRKGAPLSATTWAGKVGLSEMPPMPGPQNNGLPPWDDWARRVRVDLPLLQAYAKAVYVATDEYIGGLTDEDLSQTIEIAGLGGHSLSWTLSNLLLAHVHNHCGEVACLKGIQEVRGYPV